ncbi:adenine nucleotide alpha hydrolases-like protein [Gonapodya prolifera JEL478]|uniref:Adenine nucleotide alpha hydrolases-like protein n=1 Tax=Gonapodya prolifera (strain JEL478) TaxID=1344416 RepID=A0A139AP56_GONPJ|nr:adenine nucleotide alpha hydrolases-like protein [Gonapodya prolifera JEL478]|eukprot:KXS18508.1 adenine nucleotide alpha hydrolases-like protein [Gonapodya prolifera JEL478]
MADITHTPTPPPVPEEVIEAAPGGDQHVDEDKPKKVLIASDFSDHADAALRFACKNVVRTGDTLVMLFTDTEKNVTAQAEVRKSIGPKLRAHTERAKWELLKGKQVKCEFALTFSSEPGKAICDAGDRLKADLVVMGSAGKTLLKGLVIGSVSNYVLAHSNVPVLVYKPPGAEPVKQHEATYR